MSEIQQVPIALIDEPLIPMREQFGDAPFQELCEDVGRNGILVPMLLRDLGERKRVVYGHRRWTAAKVVGLTTVPAVVEVMDDATEVRKMIGENTGREDVSDAEKGRHYVALMEKFSLNVEQCAAMVNKPVEYVDKRVDFVSLDPDIADANRDGAVSWTVAQELLRVNPYTAAMVLRVSVDDLDADRCAGIERHRKMLLDLCIRCGATGKVARSYIEQWKTGLLGVNPYVPPRENESTPPPVAAQMPRCISCGRDSDPGNMAQLYIHFWEKARVLKILRDSGMEVFE